MIFTPIAANLSSALAKGFLKDNSINQMEEYRKFRAFYDNDKEEIKEIIYKEMIEKEIIDKDTPIERIIISHLDIVTKTINRKISGVFDNTPTITLEDEANKPIESNAYFDELITRISLFEKVEEACLKAEFVNISLIQVIWRDGELELDVLTPDMFTVIPKSNYNKIREIALPRCKYNENGEPEMYTAVWSDTEHYLLDSNNNPESVEGNPNNKNPYGIIPIAIYRKKEGSHFLGEPNYNLYDNQVMIDILYSGTNSSDIFNVNEITLVTGFVLQAGPDGKVRIKANELLNTGVRDKDEPAPDVKRIGSSVDITKSLDNVEKRVKLVHSSEGLPASSASTEQKALSGTSKTIDEIELQESREKLKTKIYKLLMELIPIIILVNNTPPPSVKNKPKKIEGKYKINIQLSEEKMTETPADKKLRREEEVKYNMSTAIDFIMEDKEVDEKKAQEIYDKNKAWKESNMNTKAPEVIPPTQ